MNTFKLSTIFLSLLVISFSTFAGMYKWVDEDGNISYSDQPPFKGAEKLDAPALTSVPPTKAPKKAQQSAQKIDKNVTKYTYLKITSPESEATIRDNGGNFSLSFAVKPKLNTKQGHYFTLNMDGKMVQDKFISTSASLNNIDRGTHKISVAVNDKSGKVLRKSKPITVYLHRQSILQNR
ncbi:hypothetical protein MNBD_GAMMA08-1321 [hydrothermal vent metagenome]|uniref:DUF4124 domain-containing protein n=1 Tax=hydrothermal vent metagenome TaxID=652676 RepID=A0A3B0XVK2_9ZZZZ